ncbi:MAG: toprim domain-containing protein [Tannerella sp.]|jgi:hypothetical protein|nr:toprim domain-containing protein [Tannerella sp.]
MNIQETKSIVLADYLQSLGVVPCKRQGNNLWYYSPFREEKEPSFKVNLSRNEWYDFALGRGGNILDFVMEQHGTDSVSHVLQIIAGKAPAIAPAGSFSFRPHESLPAFEDIHIQTLSNPALLQYLQERNIRIPFAEQVCKEIHFTANGKRYFAIGFENDLGGYELRNKYFQGCLSPKGITGIKNGNDTCCVFEGFMDYLSYLALKEKHHPGNPNIVKERDYIILNSVANLPKALDIIESYEANYCYLDNDKAGTRAWLAISDRCGVKASDQSVHYRGYKDLNDYLCGRKMEQTQQKKRGMKL